MEVVLRLIYPSVLLRCIHIPFGELSFRVLHCSPEPIGSILECNVESLLRLFNDVFVKI